MGVPYERWLVAKGNVFLPSSAAVAKLIAELHAGGWLGAGGHAIKTVETANKKANREALPEVVGQDWLDHPDREEIRLVWPALKSPLTRVADGAVAIEVHRAPEYVYPGGKNIGRLATECNCGEDLSFEWDEDEVVTPFVASSGIFAECDECSRTFDPSKGSATVKNAFDGSSAKLPGGTAYRFALKVDCDSVGTDDPKLAFAQELVALVEKEFGRAFYEFGRMRP